MRLVLHPEVPSDVDSIMGYYASIGGRELAANFSRELRKAMSEVAKRPESFSIRIGDLRRVNLHRFPIISSFVPSTTPCESWWFDTIGGLRPLEYNVGKHRDA